MKSVVKKSIFIIIACMLIISFSSSVYAEVTVKQLQNQYPTGSQWNGTYYGMSPDSTPNYIIRIVATECAGFAALMYYNYYGFDPYYYANYVYDINQVKSGDIVRYQEDGQNVGHSVWVLSRDGDMCTIAECNYDGHNSVRWGVKRSISELSYYFKYIMASDYEIGAEASFEPTVGKPASIDANIANDSITLTWPKVDGATHYIVEAYRAIDYEAGIVTSPVSTSRVDSRINSISIVLSESDDYYIVIYAYRGNYSSAEGGQASNKFTIGIPIRGISVSAATNKIEVGDTLQLSIDYTPSNTDMDKTITYTSSNSEVATVDGNGVVTGLKEGSTTITATAKNKVAALYDITVIPRTTPEVVEEVGIDCRTHVQDDGWHDYVPMGEKAGSEGRSKRMEAFQLRLHTGEYTGGVKYASHVQDIGWQNYVTDNKMSGTEGKSKRVEAIKIELTGQIAEHYDIYYRTHCENYGWLGWAKNGYAAGTAGQSLRMESIQIMIIPKGESLPKELQSNAEAYKAKKIGYSTHVQDYGWLSTVYDGKMSGTTGQSKRLEAIIINLVDPEFEGGIEYRAHIENIGWEQGVIAGGNMAGTQGRSLRLEAMEINLTGMMAEKYDIYYRTHCQEFGWLDWTKNGQRSGSEGFSYRLEGIEIKLVEKGGPAPGKTGDSFRTNINIQ